MTIWNPRQIPNSEPKFHHAEMLDGAGRSMNEWLMILISGCDFRRWVIRLVSVVEVQRWFFIPLVMVKFHVGIMTLNIMHILSILFVIGFICLSAKPSPIYGGLTLIVSGGIGCLLILSQGGSFLGLIVFLIYLGGIMVVFGYTTALATERYPET